jgi:hypothetical protein
MKRPFLPLLLALATPFLLSMSKKSSSDYTITFHTLAGPNDSPKTTFPAELNGKRLLFRIVPEFSQENIVAYQDFPSEDGKSHGMTLQLDSRGRSMLELVTRQRKDEYLLTLINAKPVDFLVMDEPVLDGQITIWQGVTDDIIKSVAKKHTRMKKGAPPTMSQDFEMLPSTKKEKQQFLEAEKRKEQEEAKRAKSGKGKEPEIPSLNLPTGPTSSQIPVEGASPPPQNPPLPPVDPSLPRQ